jgi:hypothetical protein
MLVMGQGALMLPEKTSGKNNMGMAKNSNVQPRSKGKSFKKSTEESTTFNLKQSGIHASIVMAIVMAMTPLFISTTQFGQSASAIVGDSLVANSASVLWMFLSVILFSSLIFELESAVLSSQKGFFPNLLFLLSTTLPASFLIWTIYASQVAAVWQSAEATSSEMVAQYLSMLGAQFGTLVIFMYAWATLLPESDNTRMPPTKPLAIASFGLINILALILSIYINLRPLQANGIAKLFNGYVSYSRYSDALNVGEHLLTLDPWQDVYFLGVADITTEYANTISDPQTKQETLLMAEEYYKQAYRLNPLYLRNLLGMAHINRTWAGLSQSLASREARVAQAEQFYAYMLNDKPYRVKLWVEWADFRREIGDLQGARQRIDTALKIDNTYAPANQFSTDLYLSESQK